MVQVLSGARASLANTDEGVTNRFCWSPSLGTPTPAPKVGLSEDDLVPCRSCSSPLMSTLPADQIRRVRSGYLRHGGSKRAPESGPILQFPQCSATECAGLECRNFAPEGS